MRNNLSLKLTALLLSYMGFAAHVAAMAPPLYEDYESLASYRKRLNISYSYQTQHLPAGHCWYLSETTCQQEDEEYGALMDVMQERRRNQTTTNTRQLNPSLSVGNQLFVIPVLLVRFTNHVDLDLPSVEYFKTLLNGQDGEGPNEVGSVAKYLRFASLGRYQVVFDVFDWRTTDNTEAFFAEGRRGLVGNEKLQEMFKPVLNQLDAEGVDWSKYDISGGQPRQVHPLGPNRVLDHLLVIHSGYGAELGNQAGCTPNLPSRDDRIWSQGSGSINQAKAWLSTRTGHSLGGYSVGSAYGLPRCGNVPSKMAIITHEFIHGFRLQDLYDLDDEEPEQYFGGGGIGSFGIMGNLAGFSSNLAIGGNMDPYSRYDAEWLDYMEIVENGVYAIQPSAISDSVYQVKIGYADGEYILIENRQQMFWDKNMPASGLVLWHIDENKARQNERSWPGRAGWPLQHYKIRVIQADGLFELEQNINRGDAGDFWTKGMELGPGPTSQPNSDSYYNGVTGLRIRVLSDSANTMLFQVSGLPQSQSS